MIQINIRENQNNLILKDLSTKIVCGNENYKLSFEFDEDWQNITRKLAIIIVGNHKTAFEFTDSATTLPALPNAHEMQLVLASAESESIKLVTTPLKIELEPTSAAENLEEFKELSTYVSEIISAIEKISLGDIVANTAKFAQNASNPNLLINGDFKVNQRAKNTYTETNKFTVDRWKLLSGTVEVKSNGILLNGSICQKLEHIPTSSVVASSNAGKVVFENGTFTITTTSPVLLTFAKLEVGTVPTPFSPKPFAEELSMCQRYYEVSSVSSSIYLFAMNNTNFYNPRIYYFTKKRITPTIKIYSSNNTLGCLTNGSTDYTVSSSYKNADGFIIYSTNSDLVNSRLYLGSFEADAEIY